MYEQLKKQILDKIGESFLEDIEDLQLGTDSSLMFIYSGSTKDLEIKSRIQVKNANGNLAYFDFTLQMTEFKEVSKKDLND